MKITSRKTHSFIEIRVDEIETTIFKSNEQELLDTIYNYLDIADDLASYTDKTVGQYIEEMGI